VVTSKLKSATKKSTKKTPTSRIGRGIVVTTIVAGILLTMANAALWLNNTLFDSKKFASVATESILSESSRTAIASEIVDTVLADRPIINRIVRDPATRLISSLIGSDQAKSAIEKVVVRAQTYVTSPNPQNIEFDLTGIKSITTKLFTILDSESKVEKIDTLPDTLLILDADNIPNLYQPSIAFLWIAPLAAIGAVLLIVRPHYKKRQLDLKILGFQGIIIIITSMFALLVGPLFRPALLSAISEPHYRTVTENIYNAFIVTFNTQTMWLFVFGVVMLVVPVGVWAYSLVMDKTKNKS
jgi:hypothetical protein